MLLMLQQTFGNRLSPWRGLLADRVPEELPPEFLIPDPTWLIWLSALTSSVFAIIYAGLVVAMVIYCVRNDPDRYLWIWIILLLHPFGVFIYLFARWLPSAEIVLPAWTRRWTSGRKLRQLETAALQIGNAHQHIQYGDALRVLGKHELALDAYRQGLTKDSSNLAALWGAALMEFQLKQFDSARSRLEQVLAVEPSYKFGDVSLLYGKTLIELGDNGSALEHLQGHVRKWRQPEAMYLLASLLHAEQQYGPARDVLRNLIIDIDSSPRAIARKHLVWKGKAQKLLRKLPAHSSAST